MGGPPDVIHNIGIIDQRSILHRLICILLELNESSKMVAFLKSHPLLFVHLFSKWYIYSICGERHDLA